MRAMMLVAMVAGPWGCASPGDTTPRPNQAFALKTVWRDIYGQTDDPPEIEWHHYYELWSGVGGFTLAGWKIMVADGDPSPSARFPFASTAFAHELMHERTYERTGDVDSLHIRGDWDLVDTANFALGTL